MKCYELEKMIAFAADPVKPEHAEIASHITHCKSCQSDFELVLETIQQYNAEPLPGDAALAKDVTSAFLAKKNTWEKFQNFVEKTVNLFQEQIKKGSMFLKTEQIFSQAQTCISFAASASDSKAFCVPVREKPTITFESDEPNFSDYYWKAQMELPMLLSATAMIQMTVSDKDGKNVSNGALLFLGNEYKIIMGRAMIPFKDFQKNKQCASIGLRFTDGIATSGSIRFLPESFS